MLEGRHFGTGVHAAADVTFLLEFGMGVGLLAGAVLARKEKFRLHAWCQSTVVLLNFVIICFLMLPPFREQIIPKIPSGLGKFYYSIATLHAAFGSMAEVFGLYILVAAGTKLLPKHLRLRRYKLWMRSVLVLWWIALLLGFVTYARWHWPQAFRR